VNLIPKIIHISWKDGNVLQSQSALIQLGIKSLERLNPDWKINFYTDNDIDQYLQKVLDVNDYHLVKSVHIVEKTDLWRHFKIYREGGMYIDIDRLCNVRLDSVLDDDTLCVLPTCADVDFSQDFLLSAPGNRIYQNTIDLILERRRQGHTNTYFLGPQTYMHSVTQVLFGQMIDSHPGAETFNQIRSELAKIPYIKTYRESSPYDTFVYRGPETETDWETMKRQFYRENNTKHWTGEW
jgi:mannosyltransferase OCH1-like enzyme